MYADCTSVIIMCNVVLNVIRCSSILLASLPFHKLDGTLKEAINYMHTAVVSNLNPNPDQQDTYLFVLCMYLSPNDLIKLNLRTLGLCTLYKKVWQKNLKL